MKNFRTLCVLVVLTLALMSPALAGDISTPFAPPPPASSVTVEEETGANVAGNIHTMNSNEAAGGSSATETALNLLQSVLFLF